jgi:2-amino-4-hydroxy-6-hydroxymethyldihydropteridine diphosphokinase
MNFLALGSNLGDRAENLRVAREKLSQQLGVRLIESPVMATAAIGFNGAEFLNQVVAFEKEVKPLALLNQCQQIEQEMGRAAHEAKFDAAGRRVYENRVIDIDLLTCDGVRIQTRRLTLPHPQCWERPYIAQLVAQLPDEIQKQYRI